MQPFGCLSPGRFTIVDIETSEGFDCEEVFGRGNFQNRLVLFTMTVLWVMHSHTLALPLISADIDHWCRQPPDVALSADDWKSIAIPVEGDGRHSRCTVYANLSDLNDTRMVECDSWDYDLERAESTIVSEWNLVCNRRSLKVLATAVFMAGALGFLFISGYCADRFGRLPVVAVSATTVMLATLGSGFATSYPMYVSSTFLISGSTISLSAMACTILAETCSCAHRPTSISLSFMAGSILGDTYFSILRQTPNLNWFRLQLLMVAPTLLLPIGLILVVESPRWLIARRRLEAAERVMRDAAKLNGGLGDQVGLLLKKVEQRLEVEQHATVTTVAIDMTRVVRCRAVIIFGSSFSVMIAYYTLLLSHAQQRTDTLWVEWVTLGANVLAYCLLLRLVNRVDKTRLLTIAFMVLASLCCLASISEIATAGASSLHVVGDIVHVLAQAACSVAMSFNYVYVLELFPTPIRGVAVCLSLAAGRLGGMAGALISMLRGIDREDLLFALISTTLYSSAYSFQYLPLEYGTYARLADTDLTVTSPVIDSRRTMSTVDAMKQSLTPLSPKKKDLQRKRRESGRKRLQRMIHAL